MHVFLLICHPHPGSFTHAIAQQAGQTLLANQHTFSVVIESSLAERKAWLEQVEQLTAATFSLNDDPL